ncbi:hypothetical protein Pan44_03490 [Caulifigura coniformis]|uniref:Uncharacterized protein n=2 Tax=Caulifigura coniformis TaxID=2527983 RepID=A0A517S8A1_9PLAN|nr:hypothetical protein Pan44_03490 [Caulifigura coniformis]
MTCQPAGKLVGMSTGNLGVAVTLAWLAGVGLAYWAGGTLFALIVASVPVFIASQLLPSRNQKPSKPKAVKPSKSPTYPWSD